MFFVFGWSTDELNMPLYGHYCSCKHVWPGVVIFLCFWHLRWAWTKNTCIQVINIEVQAKCLKVMGDLMYDMDVPDG
jgi:hypothetical protein